MKSVRCVHCGLVVQVPPGSRRLCGCGDWLSAEEGADEAGAAPLEADMVAVKESEEH